MYEESEVSIVRRVLWSLVTFATIFAVLWGIVWILFLRHTPAATTHKSTSSSAQQHKSAASSTSSTTVQSPTTTSGTTPSPTPTQLVNTGAGDVIGLFVTVTVVSGAAYQVRLRTRPTV